MDWNGLKRDWRIWLLAVSLIVSFGLVFNITDPYRTTPDGDSALNTNIRQGLSLQGGARVLVNLTGENVTQRTVTQTINTLETRISAFGLQDMSIRPVGVGGETYIQIELAGADTSDLTELINRTGRFEARMPITVADGYTFTLGQTEYTAHLAENGSVTVGGKTAALNDTFTLRSGPRDITFTYTNRTASRAVLTATAFTGDDMLGVDISSRVSGVTRDPDTGRWVFRFQNSVTESAAERVQDIAQA
ncbi:MAG: hypothetical protein ABEK12_00705, partial [Candidatus Nanohaloarchaea archaeon]